MFTEGLGAYSTGDWMDSGISSCPFRSVCSVWVGLPGIARLSHIVIGPSCSDSSQLHPPLGVPGAGVPREAPS